MSSPLGNVPSCRLRTIWLVIPPSVRIMQVPPVLREEAPRDLGMARCGLKNVKVESKYSISRVFATTVSTPWNRSWSRYVIG